MKKTCSKNGQGDGCNYGKYGTVQRKDSHGNAPFSLKGLPWAGDSGYDNTAFDMAEGIEPTSILCLGKMWRKTFPA